MFNNKKKIFLISVIVLIILIILKLFITYYNNYLKENIFKFNRLKYNVPAGTKYSNYENERIKIVSNKGWIGYVTMFSESEVKFKSIDDAYDYQKKENDFSKTNVYKTTIKNVDVLIFDYLNRKELTCAFITQAKSYDSIYVYYNSDNFDLNLLSDVIESLSNPTIVNN